MGTPDVADRSTGPAGAGVPGPSGRTALRYWAMLLRDPVAAYGALRREYGDAVRLPVTRRRGYYILSRPEHAEHVLVARQARYVKAFTYRPLRAFLGDGLLTSEGETWQRHRRLIQPVFHRRRIQTFAPAMVAVATARMQSWRPGQIVDIAAELRTLTMDVVGRVLFGSDLAARASHISRSVTRLQDYVLIGSLLPTGDSPQGARMIATRLFPGVRAAANTLTALVDRMIDERLAAPHAEPVDLLDLLIGATDGGQPLSRQEIHDEVMTLALLGHETTANALVWAILLLSRFPAARERLHEEVDGVLAGRPAEAADVDRLVWTNAVVAEAMRLYPPAWTIERDAVAADEIGGIRIPVGSTVAIPPYLLHRHPEFWPNPEGFDPERFLAGRRDGAPRYA